MVLFLPTTGGAATVAVVLLCPCSSFTPLLNGASTSRDGSYSSSKDYVVFSWKEGVTLHSLSMSLCWEGIVESFNSCTPLATKFQP